MKRIALLMGMALMVLMSWAQSAPITEVPADGEEFIYMRSGKCYYPRPYINSEGEEIYYIYEGDQGGSMTIVKVGSDVYIKDPVYGLVHDTYVKGKMSDDGKTITVSLPQVLYYDEAYQTNVVMGVGKMEGYDLYLDPKVKSVTYTLSEDEKTITLEGSSNMTPLGAYWGDNEEFAGRAEWETELTLYVQKLSVTHLPDGVNTTDMPLAGTRFIAGAKEQVGSTVKVGFDADTIYVQGLVPLMPEAWSKGTFKGGVAHFPVQFLGYDASDNKYYLASLSGDGKNMAPFTMSYDEDLKSFAADAKAVITPSDLDYDANQVYATYTGLYIGKRPEPIAVPTGLTVKPMTLEGIYNDGERELSLTSIVKVAVSGSDVYMQGLFSSVPDGWIKGTFDELGVGLQFPFGQYVGYDDNGNVFAMGDRSELSGFTGIGLNIDDPSEIKFVYDAKKDTYRLLNKLYASRKKSELGQGNCFEVGMMINAGDTWIAANQGYENSQDVAEVRISEGVTALLSQGANSSFVPKYYNSGEAVRMYAGNMMTISSPDKTIVKVVFNMTGAENQMKLTANEGNYSFANGVGTWKGESNQVVFSVPNESGMQARIQSMLLFYIDYSSTLVEVPKELIADPYLLEGMFEDLAYWEPPVQHSMTVNIGFLDDEVYFQGLSQRIPEAWVKGKLVDGKVSVPEWYMGSYIMHIFIDIENQLKFSGAEFNYNEATGQFTCAKYETLDPTVQSISMAGVESYTNLAISKMAATPATPANPEIEVFNGVGSNRFLTFEIKQQDTEGKQLVAKNLGYIIYIEKGGVQSQLTFTKDLYRKLTEDMTVVPYGFTSTNFRINRVNLLQGGTEIRSWNKIGIQSVYTVGTTVNASEVVWKDLEQYWIEGIGEVGTTEEVVTYYDMQGRLADAHAKGLLLKQVRQADGTVKTIKVMRR